jgi:hypothetical protein
MVDQKYQRPTCTVIAGGTRDPVMAQTNPPSETISTNRNQTPHEIRNRVTKCRTIGALRSDGLLTLLVHDDPADQNCEHDARKDQERSIHGYSFRSNRYATK